jgi:hypothetical protein
VGTLGALRFVVNEMRGFPGRKSVVLFTENIRMIFQGTTDEMVSQAVQQLSDAASRASVVIHAIDPRGMQDYEITPADDTSRMSGRRRSRVPAQREQEMVSTEEGMFTLAEETGGLFLRDTNDLSAALRKAAEDSDGYYLIGYHPDANTFEDSKGQPKFHKVEVKLKAAGLHVRSRTGFFGDPSGNPMLEHTREAELTHALQSPFTPGPIHPRLTAVFTNLPKTGSAINAFLYFKADELKWSSEVDGSHKASLDIAAAVFDENGMALAPVDTTFNLQLSSREYDEALKKGMVYGLRVPVAKPGPYLVRAALRDPATEGSGSVEQFVEVPDVENGHLALSGIVLQEAMTQGTAAIVQTAAQGPSPRADITGGAARRSFRRGSALTYAYDIFNAKMGSAGPELEVQTRMFRDGEQVTTGKSMLASDAKTPDPLRLRASGSIALGREMAPGEYVLQVVVIDKLVKSKFNLVSQSMDFIIEP